MNRPVPTLGNPKNTIEILNKYKFIELKANLKAVPEREGGKPQV